ncbi:glutamine-hydrolyzing GMP synthase [Spiroplasma platyhelix]|uniref:GMP synthase [glutamine-hydrolyzing] n=1 Tax=Spiroplasma platyhelix PALS-1 TaxID=1276218 RepID=A0A846TWE1_9MOLU|nr:glutamine-hydrolyzing GMP synthase [Spiroplasma platyhelix]MBE4704122.1 GMP synthase [glutamine-hydrolyzing] [Spiroplasma platyhelix PALS-1]NKE38492.1 glutamine-hydrolyzing GMP synthase [Spiroplasma platyhelix PALS-1]UJB29380.1 GMP synthase [Spiroplasma platyhelix PALS-1]
MNTQIIILDYGSQYTQLLARRIRELNVYAEVVSFNTTANDLKKYQNLKGIILSGGPSSVYANDAYSIDQEIFNLNLPILGVCYGMQLITEIFGGKVELANSQEFGKAILHLDKQENKLFENVKNDCQVWMSHADHLTQMPKEFVQLAYSDSSVAAIANLNKNIYGIQFHAEVTQSEYGIQMIENFLFKIANCNKDWTMQEFIKEKIQEIKTTVGSEQVILGLSGGVDSSVAAVLLSKAIGKQLTCIFVDTGLLRKNEAENVMNIYAKEFDINIKLIDAQEQFYNALKGITDPEEKRKIIGHNFIEVFNKQAQELNNAKFLAQGTIYPDVIESSSEEHNSKTIKSHHNVGGLPEDLKFSLLEPLRNLFKDEVRKVGRELGIPDVMINRHPFPGPGLGIRVIGEVTKEKCDILREVDDIFIKKLIKEDWYNKTSQAFVTLLPVKTVGVMGDNRTYDYVVALRCVNTIDFMTATTTHLPWEFLEEVVNEIINKVKKVNRVVYDITSKPPGTIEWE